MCYGNEYKTKNMNWQGTFPPFPHFHGKEISGMVKGIFNQVKNCVGNFEGWIPYDITEMDNYYRIDIPLPGLTKEDFKVSLISGCLNVSTTRPKSTDKEVKEKKSDKYSKNGPFPFMGYWFSALWEKDVNLDVPLPVDANEDGIKSIMKNGLLKIKIEKKPARKIDVNTEDGNGENKSWNPKK